MKEAMEKLMYAGLGLAAQATEKVEKQIDDLVEKGKLSDLEAKKFIEDFLERTETTREEFDSRFKGFVEKFNQSKTSELDELRNRVEELEAKLAAKKTTASKKAAATA